MGEKVQGNNHRRKSLRKVNTPLNLGIQDGTGDQSALMRFSNCNKQS